MKITTKYFQYSKEKSFDGLFAFSISCSKRWGMIGIDAGKHSINFILWRPKGSWEKSMRKIVRSGK